MLIPFRAERTKEEERMDMADRGGERTMEQDLRTWGLMTSGPVAEAGSRQDRKFSTFSGRTQRPADPRYVGGKMGTEQEELGTRDLEANTEGSQTALFIQGMVCNISLRGEGQGGG